MSQTFIIHLERSTNRRPHADKLLAASPFPAQIWPACDGAAMEPGARAELISQDPLFAPAYPFPLSMGEVGCFESHRSVWKHMVDQSIPSALILEDDVAVLPDAFEAAVALAAEHIEALGYIQLQVRDTGPAPVVEAAGNVTLTRPEIIPLRTSAQLVSLDAAKRLLAHATQIDRPVDGYLQLFWETGVRPHCVVPSGVSDLTAQSGGSTVSRKRSLGAKVQAAYARAVYRRGIKTLSKANP